MYRWCFSHKTKFVWFGPYVTEVEAKEAFQRRFGYWPEDAIHQVEYDSSERV